MRSLQSFRPLYRGWQQARGVAAHQPDEFSPRRLNELRWVPFRAGVPFEHSTYGFGLLRAGHEEDHARRVVQNRERQRDSKAVELLHPIRDNQTSPLG